MHSSKPQGLIRTALAVLASLSCPGQAVDYLRDIKPVLQARCYACHGALKQKAGLRVDTAAALRLGSSEGAVLVPGAPEQGSLLARLTTTDEHERMPLEAAALKPEEIAAIREWIAAGAPLPDSERGEADPREHWAFQRIERPTGATGIDALLEAKHREHSLKPQPEADRGLLLRRLYLDLVGLPPSEAQLEDVRPYETIVDELLASPQHGERWARHWMDVWRYSDWYGLGDQLRNSQKHLWHWRDWIVESLNADKGYNGMIHEMLAGDEIAPSDPTVVRATGFLARNYYLFNRTTWLDDTLEHTGKAFLGLTLNCAKCHDHKYDPVSMVDYYNLRALFEPHQVRLDPVPGIGDFEKDGLPRVFDNHLDAETFLHVRGDPAHPDKSIKITPAVPAIFAGFAPPIEAVPLPIETWAPASREHVMRDRRAAIKERAGSDPAVAEAELAQLEAAFAADRSTWSGPLDETLARAASQAEAKAMKARAERDLKKLGEKGDAAKIKAARESLSKAEKKLAAQDTEYTPVFGAKKALETPEHNDRSYATIYPRTSSGRRLMLARWITSRENPLTARVAVNQVWMRHFGEPLVETVFDFGRQAPRPEHLELLDFLSAEFIESGWSFRHLHRLIVTSDAYRRSSSNAGADPATLATDPANRFYWRAHPRRMESQVLRDSLLSLAGNLDLTMGGPPLPADGKSNRRSLYFIHSRDEEDKFLTQFDNADILQCYRRTESIVPQQALALANSAVSLSSAGEIARHLEGAGPDEFVEKTFVLLLGRGPDSDEQAVCREYWKGMEALDSIQKGADPESAIRARFVHALLNHNDFVTIR